MEWYQILGIIFCGLGIDCVFGGIVYVALEDSCHVLVPMPSDFKCYTEMNWFGCVVCYILLLILFPIWNIGKLIYWLFHI